MCKSLFHHRRGIFLIELLIATAVAGLAGMILIQVSAHLYRALVRGKATLSTTSAAVRAHELLLAGHQLPASIDGAAVTAISHKHVRPHIITGSLARDVSLPIPHVQVVTAQMTRDEVISEASLVSVKIGQREA